MTRKIRQVAVIGSGVMGGGIAALFAGAGIRTLLLDIVPFDLTDAEKKEAAARNRIVKQGFDAMCAANPPLLMHPDDRMLIRTGNLDDNFQDLAACDWIIEVVVENLKIKQALLKRIETVRQKGSIVSTNTSGIPLQAMSEGLSTDFKQHFLGTHFFNPVRYMKLLELIPGAETLPEILSFTADYGERILGKGIVWAKDTPNFVGNRIGVHGIIKAMHLMAESGLTIPEVDALFGPAMGRPKTAMFKTSDLVGLDIVGHVAKNTYDLVEGDEARNDFIPPEFLTRMIDKKLLGKKVKAGFYKTELTPEWKLIRKVIDLNTLEYAEYGPPELPCLANAKKAKTLPDKIRAIVNGDDKGAVFAWKAIAHNLLYAANRMTEIADTILEIDNAMRWGFIFELGPFETWDVLGLAESVDRMKADGFDIPENISGMLAAGNTAFYKLDGGKRSFYDFNTRSYKAVEVSENIVSLAGLKAGGKTVASCASASLVDIGDGVFCCEFHSKMNALNEEIIEFMGESLDYVDENGVGLVIGNQATGMPGAFSAGADLKALRQLVADGKFDDIEAFVKRGQDGGQRAKYAPFPVVAAPFGLTLGGGCEICLAADRIVAHTDLYMGLVEMGVGLIPAGGGCLNLWKRFIRTIPKAVTDADIGKFFVPAFMNIAMAKVSMSAAEARANGFLTPTDRIVFNRDYLVGEAKKEVLRMVDSGYAPPVKQKLTVFGELAHGMINAELHNMKSAGFVSEHDALLAGQVAFVLSGGDIRLNSKVDEETILALERQAFVKLLQEEKTIARIDHMLKTGKPLRN
ncbi:MAG: 3-hydroxyacyl-CoA dehydrogenase/enoyl-CoA hydratase family protein [Desulfobacteraceae bacterium]|nr:3-hydroxyacyl-CoA dehydrogenase/enoyl-CoA hydratase family protein [Desulfobacteraceae bacterium]